MTTEKRLDNSCNYYNGSNDSPAAALPAPIPSGAPLDAAPRSPAAVYIASLGERSRRTMTKCLHTVVCIAAGADPRLVRISQADALAEVVRFQWSQLRYEHVQSLRAQLGELYSPAGANKALAALRRVLEEAFNLGQLGAEEYQRCISVKGVKGSREPPGRALDPGEILALFDACKQDRRAPGRRDAALLALLCVGLRRTECVELTTERYQEGRARVLGKGNKERIVPMPSGAKAAVDAWMRVRGDAPGPLPFTEDSAT